MSGGPIRCSDALDQLWALLDQEICDEDAAPLREHLERCQHCYPQYDFERAYRQLLAMQCNEQAPPELRRRIFMRLLEETP